MKIEELTDTETTEAVDWPSVVKNGDVYGVPIWIGGSTRWKRVTLQDADQQEISCKTDQNTATDLLPHMWTKKVRATGTGKWKRVDEMWELTEFKISGFEIVADVSLESTIRRLQGIDAEWKKLPDPLEALKKIRSGEE